MPDESEKDLRIVFNWVLAIRAAAGVSLLGLGGWDKCRVFFVVMVERENEQPVTPCNPRV